MHVETAMCMCGAGNALYKLGESREALVLLAAAAEAFESTVGPDDPRFKKTLEIFSDIF